VEHLLGLGKATLELPAARTRGCLRKRGRDVESTSCATSELAQITLVISAQSAQLPRWLRRILKRAGRISLSFR